MAQQEAIRPPVAGHIEYGGVPVKRPDLTAFLPASNPALFLATMLTISGATLSAAAAAPDSQPASAGGYCAMVKNPSARDTCFAARAEFFKGNYRTSLSMMGKAFNTSPRDAIIRVQIALIMIRLGDTAKSERQLRLAQKQGAPAEAVVPVLLYTMVANHEEITLLNEFPEPAPNAKGQVAAAILLGRARAFQSRGQIPEAVKAMDRSLSLDRNSDALLFRAELATKQNDAALAKKLVNEAYQAAPDDAPAMGAQLLQLERANDTAAALALADRMIKLYPINSDPRESKIRIFLKQNQDARAKAEVDAILALRPKSYLAQFYSAVLLSRAKNKKAALQIIMLVPLDYVRLHPEYAMQMAQIALDNGNDNTAAAILGAALGAAPDMLDVRLKLAAVKLGQKSPQGALLVLTPAQDSADPRIKKMLDEVHAQIAKDRAF
jgi:tetratricopeptide (TPR) repeat protein